ncbi:30S ribosomal protein S11 [bacterium]|nr:30S ribosomal protein S11 [bacterium]
MGKKRVVSQSVEQVLEEKEKVESALKKATEKGIGKKAKEVRVYINSTYNNTMITITDLKGNVICWSSAGSIGFSGPKKATPFAAAKVAEAILQKMKKNFPEKAYVFVKGIGAGRDSALRALAAAGLNIVYIKDVTPIPHNGPRPPKPRRV